MRTVYLLLVTLIFFSFIGEHPKNDLAKENLKGKVKEIIDSNFTTFDSTFQSDEKNIKFQKKEWENTYVSKFDVKENWIEFDFYSVQGDTGISERSINYNKNGLMIKSSRSGTHNAESEICSFNYDLNGNLTEETVHSITDSQTIYNFYTYDSSDNMIQMKRKILKDTTKIRNYYWKYDNKNNMIEAFSYWLEFPKDINKSKYKYDNQGNEIEDSMYSYYSNDSIQSTRVYKYLAFDKLGNWIEREEYTPNQQHEGELHIRKIKYY